MRDMGTDPIKFLEGDSHSLPEGAKSRTTLGRVIRYRQPRGKDDVRAIERSPEKQRLDGLVLSMHRRMGITR